MEHRDDVTGDANDALSRRDWLRLAAAGAMVATVGPAGAFAQATRRAASAPTTTPADPDAFKFPLGADATVTIVSDGTLDLAPRRLFPKVPPADLTRACAAVGISPDRYACPQNVTLIERGQTRLLIDAGAGRLGGPTLGRLVTNLRRTAVEPETITDVAITHGDPDQIGGLLDAAGKPTFAKATVWLDHSQRELFEGRRKPHPDDSPMPAAEKAKRLGAAARVFRALGDRVRTYLAGQAVAGDVVRGMWTLGHAPQHLAFLSKVAGAPKEEILFLGDVAMLWELQLAHPEWATSLDLSSGGGIGAIETRRLQFADLARVGLTVVSPRAAFPGVGRIVAAEGGGYRWQPRA